MTTVQTIARQTGMHPVDAAIHIIKINMSKSGLTHTEIVEIANRVADELDEQTYENVGRIMHDVTGKPVIIFGGKGRTYVKIASERSIERLTKKGTLISLIG